MMDVLNRGTMIVFANVTMVSACLSQANVSMKVTLLLRLIAVKS